MQERTARTLDALPAQDRRRPRHGDARCSDASCCYEVSELGALAEAAA
jgi:hypothetical protein